MSASPSHTMNASTPGGRMRVLAVASEMFPFVKTGGLADVTGALPAALRQVDVDVTTLLPGYPAVVDALTESRVVATWSDWFGGPARLVTDVVGATRLLVLDAPHLYRRPGNPYLDADGRDWSDNATRFAALARAATEIAANRTDEPPPHVVHAHDWQAALVPVYRRYATDRASLPPDVLTIHNLAFQGRFEARHFADIGLPPEAFAAHGVEWYGEVNFLKAGLLFADAITTVSPTYAREIRGAADGMGMDAILRWRADGEAGALSGIVNGIDVDVWNPATDPALARRYDVDTLAARADNRAALEARFGLAIDDTPIVCIISRLTTQKGIDVVVDALDALVDRGVRLVVLGSGDAVLQDAMRGAALRHRGRVGVVIGYDEALSHRMQGGADAILVPSRFEPCGLTQLCALRYGCVPIVARVGGLADTVVDADAATFAAQTATGFHIDEPSVGALLAAVDRARRCHADPVQWRFLQQNGMRSDVGWNRSAAEYAALYRRLVSRS